MPFVPRSPDVCYSRDVLRCWQHRGYGISRHGRQFKAGRFFYLLAVEAGGHGWSQHLLEAQEPPPPLLCNWAEASGAPREARSP